MLLLISVMGISLVGAGMVYAGHLTYDYFNTPVALPITHPATATPTNIPATATPTNVPVTVTAADATETQGAVTPGTTPNVPTVTP
jgi:hypothetical protein